jgi:hypothetical protein
VDNRGANANLPEKRRGKVADHDASTNSLLNYSERESLRKMPRFSR